MSDCTTHLCPDEQAERRIALTSDDMPDLSTFVFEHVYERDVTPQVLGAAEATITITITARALVDPALAEAEQQLEALAREVALDSLSC